MFKRISSAGQVFLTDRIAERLERGGIAGNLDDRPAKQKRGHFQQLERVEQHWIWIQYLASLSKSRQDVVHNVAVNVGEAEVAPTIAIRQLFVIDSHQVQDGRM